MLGSVECPFETQFEETAVMELNRGVIVLSLVVSEIANDKVVLFTGMTLLGPGRRG